MRATSSWLALLLIATVPSRTGARRPSSSCSSVIHNATTSKGCANVVSTQPITTASACCAACSANPLCHVWTLNSNDTPPKCSLKGALTASLQPGGKKGSTTGVFASADTPWPVFTAKEVAQCGKIRIPELTQTPSRIIIWAQCRSANASSSSSFDNMLHAKVVSKMSTDHGKSWSNWTIHTPKQYSHGKGIYDRVAKTVVFQYQHHPSADPEANSSYLQRISKDDGLTWSAERDITDQLVGCNPYRPIEMEVESAGSNIQTSSGRLVFTGHSKNNDSCTWYSDDHGSTYHSSNRFSGNEISVAELSPGNLIMNGRGGSHVWNPNRSQYYSTDDGTTWGAAEASVLTDNNQFGCEAALIAMKMKPTVGSESDSEHAVVLAPAVLFYSEPVGASRTDLVLRCSLDGGATWPGLHAINGHAAAAYSAMLHLPQTNELLVVWESGNTFIAEIVDTKWCV